MTKYLKKYWLYCLLAPLFMLGEIVMDLLQPALMARVVDEGVLQGNLAVIFNLGWRMVLLVVFGGSCGMACAALANITAQKVGNDLRKDLFRKMVHFSFGQTRHFSTGSLVTRITNDVSQLQNFVTTLIRSLVRTTFMFFGALFMLYRQSPRFAWVAACGLPVVAALIIWFLRRVSPLYAMIQKKLDKLNTFLQENLAGMRVVKAYVKEEEAGARFSETNDQLCEQNLKAQRTLAFLYPGINVVLNACMLAVLYVSGYSVRAGVSIQPGHIMAAITYLTMILMRVIFLANIFQVFTRAAASSKRVQEILETEPGQKEGSLEKAAKPGALAFENVSFAYPDLPGSPVLQDISFCVEPGQTVALVGSTGSGKSSLLHLIPRFFDVTEGRVLVGGLDVREYRLKALREAVGIVLQRPELFARSLAENLRWGDEEATEEALAEALDIAQAREFVEAKTEGYDTEVSEEGHSLSGGQKQRLAIARTLLKKPALLLLDDSGSALDLRTEARLYRALHKSLPGVTKLIVAQRIAPVRDADCILVLEAGRLVDSGKHGDLLQRCAVYRDICRSQLSPEEVS